MQLQIETPDDEQACIIALANWVRESLKRSGYLNPTPNESPYYTARRQLLVLLEFRLKRE